MKMNKSDKIFLIASCPIFFGFGFPLAIQGDVVGIVAVIFGYVNLILGLLAKEDKTR